VQIDNESVSKSDEPGGVLGPLSKPDVILPSSAIILLFIPNVGTEYHVAILSGIMETFS